MGTRLATLQEEKYREPINNQPVSAKHMERRKRGPQQRVHPQGEEKEEVEQHDISLDQSQVESELDEEVLNDEVLDLRRQISNAQTHIIRLECRRRVAQDENHDLKTIIVRNKVFNSQCALDPNHTSAVYTQ